jgi:hypothetical protein
MVASDPQLATWVEDPSCDGYIDHAPAKDVIMPMPNTRLRIVTLPGDGIGREIVPPTVHLLGLVEKALGGFTLDFEERRDMGALYYRESGEDISEATFGAAPG